MFVYTAMNTWRIIVLKMPRIILIIGERLVELKVWSAFFKGTPPMVVVAFQIPTQITISNTDTFVLVDQI